MLKIPAGRILFATFILVAAGLLLVIARRRCDPWWRFMLYGLGVSIVPGAITDWPFHEPRLMGYAVFLLVVTIPALEWLFASVGSNQRLSNTTDATRDGKPASAGVASNGLPGGV